MLINARGATLFHIRKVEWTVPREQSRELSHARANQKQTYSGLWWYALNIGNEKMRVYGKIWPLPSCNRNSRHDAFDAVGVPVSIRHTFSFRRSPRIASVFEARRAVNFRIHPASAIWIFRRGLTLDFTWKNQFVPLSFVINEFKMIEINSFYWYAPIYLSIKERSNTLIKWAIAANKWVNGELTTLS